MEAQGSKSRCFLPALKEKPVKSHPKLLFWGVFAAITLILGIIIVRAILNYFQHPSYSAPLDLFLVPYLLLAALVYAGLGLIFFLGRRKRLL